MSRTLAIIVVLAIFLKSGTVSATPSTQYGGSRPYRPCVNFQLPVKATAHNAIYDIVSVHNNVDTTAYAVDLDTWNSRSPQNRTIKNITITSTYSIGAQLCIPPKGAKKTFLQIVTHGGAFDKRYWDAAIDPEQYAYVDAALEAGYSVLTYDRLGKGSSDHPDGATVVQLPLQAEILRRITDVARSGELIKHAPTLGRTRRFEKMIHVGHSMGSILTATLLSSYGNLSDAAILTGYVLSSKVGLKRMAADNLQYARENDAWLFANCGKDYLVIGDSSALQHSFFSTRRNERLGLGGFDPEVLDYAYSIRYAQTTGEGVSFEDALPKSGPEFRGPLMHMAGEHDFVACAGDCKGTYDPEELGRLYPHATNTTVYLQPGTGHGLTLHKGARVGYQVMFDFLDNNGL